MSTDTPTEVKEEVTVLSEYLKAGHESTNRLFERWKSRVYFLEGGKARFGIIVGYILGLMHAGQEEFAGELADSIDENMNCLSHKHNDFEIVVEEETDKGKVTRTVTVPNQKCVVGDDSTWHSFNLMWYRVLRPDVYEERLAEHQAAITAEREEGKDVYETAHHRVVKALQIRERLDVHAAYSEELTEYRYIGGEHKKIYYVPSHNGGLIYHGPGSGETFSVNISSGRTLWGIHT
jgi:hypothetical protein